MKCWKQSPQTRCSFTLFLWYFWKYRCLKIRNCCSYSWWFEAVITDYVCCYCFTKSNTLLYTAHSQSHVSLCVVRTQSKQPKFTLCAQFIYRSTDVAQMLGHGRGWAVWAVLMWICYCWSAAKFISSIIREWICCQGSRWSKFKRQDKMSTYIKVYDSLWFWKPNHAFIKYLHVSPGQYFGR